MSMMTLKCPKCGGEAKLSLVDSSYSGPRRCWKCHEYFTITIENGRVTFCEPLSEEEFERQQEAKKAAEKMGGSVSFSRREEPKYTQKAAEKPRSGIDFSKQAQFEFPQTTSSKEPPKKNEEVDIFKVLAGKSGGGIDISRQEQPQATKPENPPREEADIFKVLPVKPESGINVSKQAPTEFPPESPVKPPEYIKPASPKITSSQKDSQKLPPVFPPERYQTFVPMEEIEEKPKKPKKDGPPPEKFNLFIPPSE